MNVRTEEDKKFIVNIQLSIITFTNHQHTYHILWVCLSIKWKFVL